jgi:serine/threonine-protein kinase RsbW
MFADDQLSQPQDTGWTCDSVRSPHDMARFLDAVVHAMTAAGFTARDLFAMRLALEEAIVNAVEHGHRGDGLKRVGVRYCVSAAEAVVEVEDQGKGFDPSQVPDPTTPENRERTCGRGLFLMRHCMTWVRHNHRGNCVTLCRCRSAA